MGALLFKQKLLKCTNENTEYYKFNNQKFYCKVVDIYDGDTITIAVKLNNLNYINNCRNSPLNIIVELTLFKRGKWILMKKIMKKYY